MDVMAYALHLTLFSIVMVVDALNNLKKKVELICDGFFYEEKIANINEEIGKLNKKEEEK